MRLLSWVTSPSGLAFLFAWRSSGGKWASLTFRFLFAYHDVGFPGPTVGQYEFAPRSKQRRETVVTKTLGATKARLDGLLRLPGDAAPLPLFPAEGPTRGAACSLLRRCESDQPAFDCSFCNGT